MKRTTILLALGLAACAATTTEAADWNNGANGVRDHGGLAGVPVPAPIPVMESFQWYLRADIGMGLLSGGKFTESGLLFGTTNGDPATTPIPTSSSWYDSKFDTFISGGLGVGRYFNPWLRGDITVETRTKSEVQGNGSYSYLEFAGGPPPIATGNTVRGSLVEQTDVRDTTFLANGYWDLRERGRFTPYIGLGAGFAVRSLERTATNTQAIYDPAGVACCSTTNTFKGKDHVLAPAASATAGAAIALSPGTVLDVNYKFTWIGEAESSMLINGQKSTYKVGDTQEHAIRAGVRWNVW